MSKPKRVQLQRKKGWKMPPDTVSVARPTKWGNPYKIGRDGTREQCVALHRKEVEGNRWSFPSKRDIQQQLRGKNLACWCKLSDPCHTDTLLEVANS